MLMCGVGAKRSATTNFISYRLITALVIDDEFFEHRRSSTLRTEFDSNVSNRSENTKIQKKKRCI